MSQEVNIGQMALAAATAALGGAFTWLWNRLSGVEARLDARITEARKAATSDTRDIWTALDADRRAATAARERTLERLGEMPTKSDIAALETRIATMLAHHLPRT